MIEKPLVAVTRPNLPGNALDRLADRAHVRMWPAENPPDTAQLTALIEGASAVVCVNGDRFDGALLDRLRDLRLIAMASVGYDSVDVGAAARRGVAVTNSPDVLSETVADTTFGLIIWSRRLLGAAVRDLRAGRWTDNRLSDFLGLDVHGATLGIVGFGSIGRAVAARAAGFGMKVLVATTRSVAAPGTRNVSLDELLAQADVVSLHVPLVDATRGLIGERELRLMKPTATLVNTSRGAVVDERALLRALREGWIHSAGLDVQQNEPNSNPDDPLLSLPNLVVLPHVGSATLAARSAMVDLAVQNVVAFLEGQPLLTPVEPAVPVTPERGRAYSPADPASTLEDTPLGRLPLT